VLARRWRSSRRCGRPRCRRSRTSWAILKPRWCPSASALFALGTWVREVSIVLPKMLKLEEVIGE
jgi:hypothetical protein